jgi:transposase
MAKYDKRFKLKIVKQYLSGRGGLTALAREQGLDRPTLRGWVASYRQHGTAGLAKKYSHYDARFKLSVLRRMWRSELSYKQTATLFDIRSPGSIGIWERRYHAGGVDALASKPRGRPRNMADPLPPKPDAPPAPDEGRTRKELLKELEYLRAENAYLKKLDALIQAKKAAAQKKRD